MEPFKHYSFHKWSKFLEKNSHSCFIQIRAKDGSYYEININHHDKSNLSLGDEIAKGMISKFLYFYTSGINYRDEEVQESEKKVIGTLPILPMSVPLLMLDDELVRTTAVTMVQSLMRNEQVIGMVCKYWMVHFSQLKKFNFYQGSFPPWTLSLPREKFSYCEEFLPDVSEELISPASFVNWDVLDGHSFAHGPDAMHILLDVDWISVLKIIIEV